MSMAAHIHAELNSGAWAHLNPSVCPCRGGWLLSDLDVIYACPIHNLGDAPPDEEGPRMSDAEYSLLRLENNRAIFRRFREMARDAGFKGNFYAACIAELEVPAEEATVQNWIDAADKVAEEALYQRGEEVAHQQGYSCGLEHRLTLEAQREAMERGLRL